MVARLLMVVSVVAVMASLGPIGTATAQNNVTLGPGYEKVQQSRDKLSFTMPQGWAQGKDAETKVGLYRVLVSLGIRLENASKVITIAFQKKDASKPGLDTLKAFFQADLQDTLSQFPDASSPDGNLPNWTPQKSVS